MARKLITTDEADAVLHCHLPAIADHVESYESLEHVGHVYHLEDGATVTVPFERPGMVIVRAYPGDPSPGILLALLGNGGFRTVADMLAVPRPRPGLDQVRPMA